MSELGRVGETRSSKIAFLTSGGDAPGMNAAIRAIVRMSIYRGCQPYAVLEGLRGLVVGGPMIVAFGWNDVAHIIGEGGTIIKSSRCPEFMERKWRKIAAQNLVNLGIDKLIVIGGDGSLTGADTFRQEWPTLLEELRREEVISQQQFELHRHLMIVGLVGSIDNDMVGTEITIGANTSLHRIIEAIDCIHSTASSHQRAFVIEVMGRHCGWLALMAAISCAADWLLIPEDPPREGWEDTMCQAVSQHRTLGRTVSIVIVAEGAVDRLNRPIKSETVRQVLQDSGLDARVTTLGHIQRGGHPSAFDRYLGTMQGIKAVEAVLESDPEKSQSLVVGMNENRITCRPLMDCVAKTRSVAEAMNDLRFKDAFALRDPDFKANHSMLKLMQQGISGKLPAGTPPDAMRRIGVMNCGAPSGGMNAAVAGIFFYALTKGFSTVGIFNGFDGLAEGDARELNIKEMFGMVGRGGSMLGTNRALPSEKIPAIAEHIHQLELHALIIIGGFEAFTSILQLKEGRKEHHSLRIPIIVIPATISNNVPGTEYSIGCDTALNVIVQSCDYIKQSATSSRKRVFVVDVHGGYCGFLAMMATITAGGSRAYTHEEGGIRLADLQRDASHLKKRFLDDKKQGRLVIRNEFSSETFSAELISKILEEEGEGIYDSRWVVLGHLQQGGSPSPLDRVRAIRLAVLAMSYVESLFVSPDSPSLEALRQLSASVEPALGCDVEAYSDMSSGGEGDGGDSVDGGMDEENGMDAMMIGIRGPRVRLTSVGRLVLTADMKLRRPKNQWWIHLCRYALILAQYDPVDLPKQHRSKHFCE